jgi:hypothetical protein
VEGSPDLALALLANPIVHDWTPPVSCCMPAFGRLALLGILAA